MERTYQQIEIKCGPKDTTEEIGKKLKEKIDKGYRLVKDMGYGFYLFDTTNSKIE